MITVVLLNPSLHRPHHYRLYRCKHPPGFQIGTNARVIAVMRSEVSVLKVVK